MKIIYTVLFFADTLVLLILAFVFFKLVDTGTSITPIILLISGIVCSIAILVYLLFKYIKIPPSNRHQ